MVYNDVKEVYKEVIDQFIDIIYGFEFIRDYVVFIFDEVKGDINRVLDIYYSKFSDVFGEYVGEGGGFFSELNQLM